LKKLSESMLLSVFEGVPMSYISRDKLGGGIPIVDFLAEETGVCSSKGEARRSLKENAISVNKQKTGEDYTLTQADLLNGKYILVQKGKKNYYLVNCQD